MSLMSGGARGLLMGNYDAPDASSKPSSSDHATADRPTDGVEQAARQTIDNLMNNRVASRTLGDLDKALQRSLRDNALAGGMGRRL